MSDTLFLKDDFDRINIKYFKKLREENSIVADPSFWYDVHTESQNFISEDNMQYYRSDYYSGIIDYKDNLLQLISAWDKSEYKYDEVTICSSTTSGSLIILAILSYIGIEHIYFETPAYFASIYQANKLGFQCHLIPTYIEHNFDFRKEYLEELRSIKNKILWITQPRFGLGYNQDISHINYYLSLLDLSDFLIIDEATEQYFPSHLSEFGISSFPNIIKIRSFFKGMGLNGPRISFLIHSEKLRLLIQDHMETFQGAIDKFSLDFAYKYCADINKFRSMITIANQQVNSMRLNVEKFLSGSDIVSNKLINGYIGSIGMPLYKNGKSLMNVRESFLKYCYRMKVPVILGATMKFAIDKKFEFVRVNYFNQESSILNGVKILTRFFNS